MTLYSFDFDDTLFHTMLPDPGMQIWQKETGTPWPHRGWWSKPETLDMDIFETPMNMWTYREYLNATKDPESIRILATGRLQKVPGMRENIEKIIHLHNFSFDEVWVIESDDESQKRNGSKGIYLNWGGDTFAFKTSLFENLIKITNCDKFIMYDDREEHLIRFEEWASNQQIPIVIVDSIRKTTTNVNF